LEVLPLVDETEGLDHLVRGLYLSDREINRVLADSGWCACRASVDVEVESL